MAETLQEFLNQNIVEGMTKEIPISNRLRDSEGKLFTATIKTVTQKEVKELRRKHTKINKKGEPEVNSEAFAEELVVENTLNPNFKDAESIKKLGCINAYQYLNKVLLSGEVNRLHLEILKFSGFKEDIDELTEEVKN
mgnify:CR=1 FL=1